MILKEEKPSIGQLAAARSVLLCSYHVLTSSVRYQSTDARQNEIYLLNRPQKTAVDLFFTITRINYGRN